MNEEVGPGDEVEIVYESTRSGNTVSRTGTVVQAPEANGKTVLFVETDDTQLTGVTSDYVFSVSTTESGTDADDDSRIQRTVSLGPLASVRSR
ncbi:hypothetical protein [Saliphagus infecundisoli]|uniref:Hypervirulence associated protein TUDOR domain-containing protein n=1 Tax=Saliphagus infecundisoli TaxID=1849069 RepID=A0ABD5QC39_9EURY|nr:hypothetical protein [Saliphagus infecundisoli]